MVLNTNKKSTWAGREAQEVPGNDPGKLTALPTDINLEGGVTKLEEVTETESASTGEAKASKKEAIYRLITCFKRKQEEFMDSTKSIMVDLKTQVPENISEESTILLPDAASEEAVAELPEEGTGVELKLIPRERRKDVIQRLVRALTKL